MRHGSALDVGHPRMNPATPCPPSSPFLKPGHICFLKSKVKPKTKHRPEGHRGPGAAISQIFLSLHQLDDASRPSRVDDDRVAPGRLPEQLTRVKKGGTRNFFLKGRPRKPLKVVVEKIRIRNWSDDLHKAKGVRFKSGT